MVKNSNTLYENEIHRVHSHFNEDSKNTFLSREALISGERQPENLGKMAKKKENYILMQIKEWSIPIGNSGLYSLVPNSLHNFGFPTC